jgi:hypothetical protein
MGAALYHGLIRRDGVLRSMLKPSPRPPEPVPEAGQDVSDIAAPD